MDWFNLENYAMKKESNNVNEECATQKISRSLHHTI